MIYAYKSKKLNRQQFKKLILIILVASLKLGLIMIAQNLKVKTDLPNSIYRLQP